MEKNNNNNIYSINLIVENQNYKSIRAQVICPSCKELKLNAKITNCSNDCQVSLCGLCAKTTNRCPKCREQPNWNDCLVIKQLISSLDFKCEKCKAIFHFDDLKDHYTTHEINNNQVTLNNTNLEIDSNEQITNEVIQVREVERNSVSENGENNNNNNSKRFKFCEFLKSKSDHFSKIINFYNIFF